MAEEKKIKIKARDKDIKGSYSNLMHIFHTREEFILDFFLTSPPEGILTSRVIMSPGHIKRMLKALGESLGRYEKNFGKINEGEGQKGKIGFNIDKK